MKKYEYLGLFISINDNEDFKKNLINNFYTFSKIFGNFKKIFILDINNLKTFSKKNYLNKKLVDEFFPNLNIEFVSPKNYLQLFTFLKKKKNSSNTHNWYWL